MAGGDFFAPAEDDLNKGYAMAQAELKGTKITNPAWLGDYKGYLNAKAGTYDPWPLMLYGPNGDYNTLYYAYHDGRLLVDAFQGIPTDTMDLKGTILRTNLESAFFDIVMGNKDISSWDDAVAAWKKDGGDQITKEVNAWYAGIAKK
jgi:putative aldouronate transport system substrate-binding protein